MIDSMRDSALAAAPEQCKDCRKLLACYVAACFKEKECKSKLPEKIPTPDADPIRLD